MADKVITIPEPTAASQGVAIEIVRNSAGVSINVTYRNQNNSLVGTFRDTDLTAAQQTKLNDIITAIINKAKAQMGF